MLPLSRRSFLKSLGISGVALTPLSQLTHFFGWFEERPPFDPSKEYGRAIEYWVTANSTGKKIKFKTLEFLFEDAKLFVPRGTFIEFRGKIPTDYGRSRGTAWYYRPGLPQFKVVHNPPKIDPTGGYILIARVRV